MYLLLNNEHRDACTIFAWVKNLLRVEQRRIKAAELNLAEHHGFSIHRLGYVAAVNNTGSKKRAELEEKFRRAALPRELAHTSNV